MTLAEALIRYRQSLELRGSAEGTIRNHRNALALFARFLARESLVDLAAVTAATLQAFQRWHFAEPTTRGTMRALAYQNRVLAGIKGLFRFLQDEGVITRDPARGLVYAREPQTLPRNVLTPTEARKIIEAPDTHTALGYRDRTILEVFYATGIRKQELMNLCLADIRLEEELLRINAGKGGQDRVVPLTAIACAFLETYRNAIRPQLLAVRGAAVTDRLFVSQRGRPIARNTLGEVVVKYAALARVNKPVTCHLWRHTCATHLLQGKANLRHVQEILGHRSLATTERYLHLTITELKEAHRKHHPRERDERAARAS